MHIGCSLHTTRFSDVDDAVAVNGALVESLCDSARALDNFLRLNPRVYSPRLSRGNQTPPASSASGRHSAASSPPPSASLTFLQLPAVAPPAIASTLVAYTDTNSDIVSSNSHNTEEAAHLAQVKKTVTGEPTSSELDSQVHQRLSEVSSPTFAQSTYVSVWVRACSWVSVLDVDMLDDHECC